MPSRTLVVLVFALSLSAADRRVAITIDDLPRGGDSGPRAFSAIRDMTARLLAPFREQRIPVIGFVNASRTIESGPDGLRSILDQWLDAGAELGNHSYSHLNLNQVGLDKYTADIVRGEPLLREVLAERGKELVFYRHPFLFTGATPEIKKSLAEFLQAHRYRVAPITIDNNDYLYALAYMNPAHRERVKREYVPYMESVVAFFEQRSVEVVGREIAQTLLIHASQMNADLMPELLAMFRRRGYTFVSLGQALADPAYELPDNYVGTNGISWLHRWASTKGMPSKDEPDAPQWVKNVFAARGR